MKHSFSFHLLSFMLICLFSSKAWCSETPIFIVTPNVPMQSQIISGQPGTAIFQISNNTSYNLNDIGVQNLPPGLTQVPSAGTQYCSQPFALAPGNSCLLKINVDSNQASGNISGGPVVCFSSTHPVYCSQPLQGYQISTQIVPGPISQACSDNYSNFNNELAQRFDSTTVFVSGWGPGRNCLMLSAANPNLSSCPTSDAAGVAWQTQRIVAAAEFWVAKKLSYCHHYNPDYSTPPELRNAAGTAGGFCDPIVDLQPGTPYYNQQARWNYSGTGTETMANWVNNNYMWYGMDCSDYTAYLYNFAFGTTFDSDTGYQSGQSSTLTCAPPTQAGHCQDNLSPNQQTNTASMILSNPNAAGTLVCADGTLEQPGTSFCAGHGDSHGNYISAIDSNGHLEATGAVTANGLSKVLQPGDLIFIAGGGVKTSPTSSEVTHVVMWLGKQVGYGPNDINPALIAPDDICTLSDWTPSIGDWVITDSHYQGADYRVLTPCFYLNNLWGVRRVIPVSVNGPSSQVPNVNCHIQGN
jgi:cell wall-associated NlpC family hydrolase